MPDKYKVHITDGHKQGDLDDLEFRLLQFDSEITEASKYGFMAEVTEDEWNQWIVFLKQSHKWRVFWNKKLLNAERDQKETVNKKQSTK